MSAGPSKGMLKKVFNPDNFKKKEKTALGLARAGGPNIHKQPGKFGGKR